MTEHTQEAKESGSTVAPGGSDEVEARQSKDPAEKAYEIDIFRDWCKACGICAAFCPRHCIELNEEGVPTVDPAARCSGCGWCEIHCPDFAISVHQVKKKSIQREDDEV